MLKAIAWLCSLVIAIRWSLAGLLASFTEWNSICANLQWECISRIYHDPFRIQNFTFSCKTQEYWHRQGKKLYIVCIEWDHVYLYSYFCRFSVFSIHWINRHVFVVARIECLRTAAAKTDVETLQWMKMIVQVEERQNKKQMYRLHLFILFKLNVKRSESIRENDDDDDDGRCNSMCVFAQCT